MNRINLYHLKQPKWQTGSLIALLLLIPLSAVNAQAVDASSMSNKVMAGYQGWFRTPGDNAGNNRWPHWFNSIPPSPEKLGFDTWPDISELPKQERYPVPGFTHPNGSQAFLYSAQNPGTVLKHFEWMSAYGIDGIWLSEFCDHFAGGRQERDTTALLTIMHNVKKAATTTGRTWAFMWDMSGFGANTPKKEVYDIIINQWKKMVNEGVTTDGRYLHDKGKPVLLLWGFFPDRPASQPDYMDPVINFLQAPGKYQATLVSGADPGWRTHGTPQFQAMLMRMSGLQPWSVGRRVNDPATGYAVQNTANWAGDIAKCQANHVSFMPVFNPGTHLAGPPPTPPAQPIVPRRTGNYLWEQFVAASKTGVINSVFIAMFDEVNEGTQIMKIDNHPPVQAPFLTYNGATSDYYLRLVGAGARMLKTRKPITTTIPISPFDTTKLYQLKNAGNAALLTIPGETRQPATGRIAGWQLVFDGLGYFKIKNQTTHQLIGSERQNERILLLPEQGSDTVKWHLEWDGTGNCQIINKASGKVIAFVGNDVKLQQKTTANADLTHWRIIEL